MGYGLNPMMKGKDAMPEKKGMDKPVEKPEGVTDGGKSTTLHDHGDGTYHTEHSDGTREEHPDLGHALTHMGNVHEPESKHMHVKHDGMSCTSDGCQEDGTHDGPHEHENIEALKDHLGKFFGEEASEGDHEESGEGEEAGMGFKG